MNRIYYKSGLLPPICKTKKLPTIKSRSVYRKREDKESLRLKAKRSESLEPFEHRINLDINHSLLSELPHFNRQKKQLGQLIDTFHKHHRKISQIRSAQKKRAKEVRKIREVLKNIQQKQTEFTSELQMIQTHYRELFHALENITNRLDVTPWEKALERHFQSIEDRVNHQDSRMRKDIQDIKTEIQSFRSEFDRINQLYEEQLEEEREQFRLIEKNQKAQLEAMKSLFDDSRSVLNQKLSQNEKELTGLKDSFHSLLASHEDLDKQMQEYFEAGLIPVLNLMTTGSALKSILVSGVTIPVEKFLHFDKHRHVAFFLTAEQTMFITDIKNIQGIEF